MICSPLSTWVGHAPDDPIPSLARSPFADKAVIPEGDPLTKIEVRTGGPGTRGGPSRTQASLSRVVAITIRWISEVPS
jgi:hypothetical protein